MEDPVAAAATEALEGQHEEVERWIRGEPGAWGRLAGRAVLAYRRRVGRSPTEAERRRVWAAAWGALEARASGAKRG